MPTSTIGFMAKIRLVLLLSFLSLFASAKEPIFQNEQEKIRWIVKTSAKLRNLHGATKYEIEKLKTKTPAEIIDQLMADTRFADTVLRFNLYFLGDEPNILKFSNRSYAPQVFYHPAAVYAARTLLFGGNYLDLLSYQQPIYISRPLVPPIVQGLPVLTPEERRTRAFQTYREEIEHLLEVVKENPEVPVKEFCRDHFMNHLQEAEFYRWAALPEPLGDAILWGRGWARDIWTSCAVEAPAPVLQTQLENILLRLNKVEALIPSLLPDNYPMDNVGDIREIDPVEFGLEKRAQYFTNKGFWEPYPNTSTNVNRKRAAKILKTFFCDDLTPVTGEAGENTATIHGSQASCTACHYKLDPMAGFFRYFGLDGISFHLGNRVIFDQGGSSYKSKYDLNWKNKAPVTPLWNVGYIRSLQYPSSNEYGEEIEDLFAIIQRAPEVKACLVKKMTHFILGEEQLVDGSYLDYLTAGFVAKAKSNSVQALKDLVSQLVLSQAFVASDPDPDKCYDYAPGVNTESRPPCRVASLIEKNCVSCHGTQAKLVLSQWVSLPEGGYGFPHIDSKGNTIPKLKTLEEIRERLTTTDLNKKMPLGKMMPQVERAQLVEWVESQMH